VTRLLRGAEAALPMPLEALQEIITQAESDRLY
jgi:hypothetical protein